MSKENLIKVLGSLSKDNAKVFLTNFKILTHDLGLNVYDYVQPSKFGTILDVNLLPQKLVEIMLNWFVITEDVHLPSCLE